MTRGPWRGIFSIFPPKSKQLKAIKRHAAARRELYAVRQLGGGGNVENAHPDLPLILSSFGFQSETPLGLMQATCFTAANDTMAFKLNTDSIANFYSCRHARRLLSKSVLQPQRIASRLSPNITLLESDNMQSHGGNCRDHTRRDESGALRPNARCRVGRSRTLFGP